MSKRSTFVGGHDMGCLPEAPLTVGEVLRQVGLALGIRDANGPTPELAEVVFAAERVSYARVHLEVIRARAARALEFIDAKPTHPPTWEEHLASVTPKGKR